MQKSVNAFRTISEVAEDIDVPQHVLRFWESKFAQVKPLKRAGGRRYYRPEDIDLLRGIRVLLYGDGYTIKGVQKLLKDQGARTVALAGKRGAKAAKPAPASGDLQLEFPPIMSPPARVPRAGAAGPESGAGGKAPLSPDLRRKLEALLADLSDMQRLLKSS